ncbi:Fanconi anemia group C protein isoform X2 [Paroedura picta]
MAEDAGITRSSFEFWLHKALQWGQITTPESQQDVCLHFPELQEFLLQIYGALKHMNCTDAVQKFPLIGQLLGRLCWNPFVIGHDECQKILMWCLCCLYSGEPQNPVELKANSWIQISLCHLLSLSGLGHHDSDINKFIATLGLTSSDYYLKLVENVISSLVTELSRNWFNRFNNQQSISLQVRSVSLLCVPFINLPEIIPLLEALLCYHGDGLEVLHFEFLEAVNEAILQKKISLSDSAVVQLWLRHLPSLEKALLQNFENLIFGQLSSVEEMICLIKGSLLLQAACHPTIFRTIEEFFKNVLLETNGAPEVMTIMQVFTRCFLQAYQENNRQHKFPLKAYFPHNLHSLLRVFLKQPSDLPAAAVHQHLIHIADMLKAIVATECMRSCNSVFETWILLIHFGEWADMAAEYLMVSNAESSDALLWLLAFYYDPNVENHQRTQAMLEGRSVCEYLTTLSRTPALSSRDLQAAVNSKISRRQPTNELAIHLIISFLLFTSNGQTIAREFIAHFAVTYEVFRVSSLLRRTAHRVSQFGTKYQRTAKLANDLLKILKFVD